MQCYTIVFLSRNNYFLNGPSKYEANVFVQRAGSNDANSNDIPFRVFVVKNATVSEEFEMFAAVAKLALFLCGV